MSKRKLVKYGVIGFIGLSVLGQILPSTAPSTGTTTPAKAQAVVDNSKQVAAVEAELKAEPKIKDLLHDSSLAVQWTVGVLPDGTSRVGYAEYVCNVIKDGGAMETDGSTYVRVVDVVKVANGTSPRSASLGQVQCDNMRHVEM